MTNEQQQVRKWMQQFRQETPEKPCIPDLATRKLRAKLELEECLEKIILGLGVDLFTVTSNNYLGDLLYSKDNWQFREINNGNLLEIADSDADQRVVGAGTLVACGLLEQQKKQIAVGVITPGLPAKISYEVEHNTDPLFKEVMRSNFSKLWTREEIDKSFILAVEFEFKKGWNNTGTLFCEQVSVAPEKWLVKDKDGKVIKSPSYSPPNLQPIIDEMSK